MADVGKRCAYPDLRPSFCSQLMTQHTNRMMQDTINAGSAVDATQPVAVVTGASRGIGRELALGLLAAGSHVLAVGRDVNALEALRRAASGARASLMCVVADVATE